MDGSKVKAQSSSEVFQFLQSNFQPGRITQSRVFLFIIEEEYWTVRVSPEQCEVECDSATGDADCTIETSKDIFLNTFNRSYTPSMMDLVNGRIKCDRPELLLALKKVFGDA